MDNLNGVREDVPQIKLSRAFMAEESENVIMRENRVRRIRGRSKVFTESVYSTGKVSTTLGSAVVTGVGTGWGDGSETPLWAGRSMVIGDNTYEILSVDSITQITLTENALADESGLAYTIGVLGTKVAAPDANPILWYHLHNKAASSSEYLFAFTKAHIYRWRSDYSAFTLKFTCSGACTLWCTDKLGNKVYATNGVDFVLVWDDETPGSDFAPLGSASGIEYDTGKYLTAANYLKVYENYIFLGYTTEDGTIYPTRRRWCSLADPADWLQAGAGDAYYNDFLGKIAIKGFGIYGANNLITFTKGEGKGSIHRSWLTTEDIIFQNDELNGNLGLLATHSVCNDKDGNLYFWGTDYAIHKLLSINPISGPIDLTVKGINHDYEESISSAYIDEYNFIYWSIAASASSTGNDLVIAYDLNQRDLDVWYKLPLTSGICTFGKFTNQETLTIDGLTALFPTIDSIGFETIDSVDVKQGFLMLLASDYDGHTWRLHYSDDDCETSFIGTLVLSTDLTDAQTLGTFKRINEGVTAFYDAEGVTGYAVIHSYKREDDANWQTWKSIDLQGNGRTVRKFMPLDIRSRDFLFRQQASNRFGFLGLYFHGFALDGEQ
ncbi:MAG: hypothetical protein PHH26_00660 [Candidatus Thermoplasmatota archaeon]|nr:hypothetical protein [Candidatus Thermoplasmatota archaeon]